MPPHPPKIGAIILNYNSADETLGCLESLRSAPCGEMRTWVVDNASVDGSFEKIPPRLHESERWLPTGSNLGYAGGNNAGIREALKWGADYALILNPDCRVEAGFLQHLVRALEAQPWAGAACAKILDRDTGCVQSLGGSFSLWSGRAKRRYLGEEDGAPGTETWSTVDFPQGACVLFKRAFLEEVGLLHEAYFLYYEDVEIGLRARREGWSVLAIPQARAAHGDTTSDRFGSPLVTYHGTRNQAWVVREYGQVWHKIIFFTLSLLARWPLRLFARLLRGKFRAAWAVVRGAAMGSGSKNWEVGSHLSVPIGGRTHPEDYK